MFCFFLIGYTGVSFAQKPIWVSQFSGTAARLTPFGLFQKDPDRFQLILKADQNFTMGRNLVKVADTSRILVVSIRQDGEKTEQDTGESFFQEHVPLLQGNQWLIKSFRKNGNYYLAYGMSTPLLIPEKLSWSLAYLDGPGHRLWEFQLPETVQVSHVEMLRDGKCLMAGSEKGKSGNKTVLISLWSEYGKEIWRKTFGGKGDNEALSACQDPEGNVYVSGYFSADSSFLGNVKDLSGKEKDGFVAGYTLSGKEKFFNRQRGEGFNSVPFVRATNTGKILFIASVQGKDWRLGPFGIRTKGKQDLVAGLIDPLTEKEKESPLVVFPNPAHELVYFSLQKPIGKGKVKATLHQKDGTILQTMEIEGKPGSSFRFNVSNTRPGAYFISLKSGSSLHTESVLVE